MRSSTLLLPLLSLITIGLWSCSDKGARGGAQEPAPVQTQDEVLGDPQSVPPAGKGHPVVEDEANEKESRRRKMANPKAHEIEPSLGTESRESKDKEGDDGAGVEGGEEEAPPE